MTTSIEILQILFCTFAFIGFLRVVRIICLFMMGVVTGYRQVKFQRMSVPKQVAYLRQNLTKAMARAEGMLKLAKLLRWQKAVTNIETKMEQIKQVEIIVNSTAINIEKFQIEAANYIPSLGQISLPEFPYLPLDKHSTTIH